MAALANQIAAMENQLRALRCLERARAARDGERPERRKKATPKTPIKPQFAMPDRPLTEQIEVYLRHNQPAKTAIIAGDLVQPVPDVQAALERDSRFERMQLGWVFKRRD